MAQNSNNSANKGSAPKKLQNCVESGVRPSTKSGKYSLNEKAVNNPVPGRGGKNK